MDDYVKKSIGKDLCLMATGMIAMQVFLYLTQRIYVLAPTLVAGILISLGSVLRR